MGMHAQYEILSSFYKTSEKNSKKKVYVTWSNFSQTTEPKIIDMMKYL